MKKQLLFSAILSLLFSLTINSFAQTSEEPIIEWTEKQSMAKGLASSITHLDASNDSFIFLYKTVFDDYTYFVKMDMATGKPQSLRLELKDKGVKREWRHVRALDGKIYIFSSFRNKKDKRYYIFVETLNKETLKLNNDARKIGEISYKDVKGEELGNFFVTLSPDKGKVLLSYAIIDWSKITRFGMQVMDKDLNPIWTRDSDFPRVEGKEVYVGNYTVDNEGNVYMGQNTYDKEKEVWNLFVTCFPVGNGEPRVQEVKFTEDKYARNETFICTPKGEIICAGLYSSPGKSSVSGTFSFLYSPQLGTLLSSKEKEFDESFITMGMLDRDAGKILEQKEKGKEFDEGFKYYFEKKLQRKDGGYSLIAEKYKLQIQARRNNSRDYYHSYNDILILTFDPDGSIRWVQKIPKAQRLVNSACLYGSYYATIDDNDIIHLLYNENTRDKISEKSQPLMVNVGKEGKISFVELFKGDEEVRKSFAPALAYKLPDKRYLLSRIHPYGFIATSTNIYWGITELE